jgi:AmmeMemoRadiSam system protein A
MVLSIEEKRELLRIARAVIVHALQPKGSSPAPAIGKPAGNLAQACGAFVTLKKGGELRGCIGRMGSDTALVHTVKAMAASAAFEDPRFPPLAAEELDDVEIEISVLTPMRRIASQDEVVVGTHGVYMRKGFRSGVFLPQVPGEWGWDRETYLKQLCRKAGLPESSLGESDTELSVFEAIVFGERDLSSGP